MNAPLLGTYNLTNAHDGLIITDESGFGKFSIQCTSATPIQIKGTRKSTLSLESGGNITLTSEAQDLAENGVFNWSEGSGIQSITILIPIGATAKLAVL